jgi:uncharacterized protein (DUF2141 family)
MKPILLATLILAATALAGAEETYTLTVRITNIPGAKGQLLVGVYDSASSFTARPLPQSPKIPVGSTSPVTARISGLKPGVYAVAVVQDLNGNGVLDRNALGMPREPLGFSRIQRIPRGKPSFAACSFEIRDRDVSMTIPLTVE